MDEREYIDKYPLSALSCRYAASVLSDEELKQYLATTVDDAAYYETWLHYFDYIDRHNQTINDDVVLAALQAVGLDPYCVDLWLRAVATCQSIEVRQRIYALGLAVPLLNKHLLVNSCRDSEGDEVYEKLLPSLDIRMYGEYVLASEVWPGRYMPCVTTSQQIEARQQWMKLLQVMQRNLDASEAVTALQQQRILLAYRQMCAQLPHDDACWYEYAMFQLRELNDVASALKIAREGLRVSDSSSFALRNIVAVASQYDDNVTNTEQRGGAKSPANVHTYFFQRALGEVLASRPSLSLQERKEHVRALRKCGKEAAASGLADWKVYAQWSTCEHAVNGDTRMAAKVLENGMVCCSATAATTVDAVLLANEVLQYHLHNGQEREALGCAEQQIELVSSSQVSAGHQHAAWNALVSAEQLLGLRATKAAARRDVFFPRSHITAFMERYRVGNYLPCSQATYAWWRFVDDFASEYEDSDQNNVVREAANRQALAAPPRDFSQESTSELYTMPDVTSWTLYKSGAESEKPATELSFTEDNPNANPDEVVGPRELRGRLVYRIKPSAATLARLNREKLRRERAAAAHHSLSSNDEDGEYTSAAAAANNTALALLLHRTTSLTLSSAQKQRINALSTEWLVQWLTQTELDLAATLTTHVTTTAQ